MNDGVIIFVGYTCRLNINYAMNSIPDYQSKNTITKNIKVVCCIGPSVFLKPTNVHV